MTSIRRLTLALLAAAAALAARPADAQGPGGTRCILQFEPLGAAEPRTQLLKLPSGKYNVFQGGGVRYRCQGQQIVLEADSAEYYGDAGILYLIGNVHYREPRANVDSDRMTYWQGDERLLAQGSVVATLPSGTVLRGPNAEYWRAIPQVRPRTRLVATGRPTVRLVQQTPAGEPQEPVDLVADRVVTEADSVVYAAGTVRITRPDVVATGDSAVMDSGREFARLLRQPTITGRGERPFTLQGTIIDLFGRNRELERVVAAGEGRATSDDVTLTADTIDLRVADRRLTQAYAFGPGRARAVSPTYDVIADSLDVAMPGQRVERVFAVGDAYAESEPDTSALRTEQRDWLRGERIVASFDTAAVPGDTAAGPRIRELVATGDGRSFYQIAADDPAAPPSANYVAGEVITVVFAEGRVEGVRVSGAATGIFVEPVAVVPGEAERPPAAAPPPGATPTGGKRP